MSRPLMQYGVGQLEVIFAESKADPKLLKQLENELKLRQVPRAVALLTEVQATMHSAAPLAASVVPPAAQAAVTAATQPELFEPAEALSTRMAPSPTVPQPLPPTLSPLQFTSAAPKTIPIDVAYKLLKATPGSAWESIEQTRRLLVQQAHPSRVSGLSSEKRAQVEAEAVQANTAYVMLSNVRCHN